MYRPACSAPARALSASEAARLEEAVPGGLGLRLMRHYCQDMSYQRNGGMNRLTLRFSLASAVDGEAVQPADLTPCGGR